MFYISMWETCQESMAALETILCPYHHRGLLNLSSLCGVLLLSRYCLRKESLNYIARNINAIIKLVRKSS